MTHRKHSNDTNESALPAGGLAPDRMGETFERLLADLPGLDLDRLFSLVEAARLFPASGRRLLLERFVKGPPAARALAYWVLAEVGSGVSDDLNALVFDASQSDETKVRADELLAEFGQAIDPDVLATSVSDPAAGRRNSPWQVARDLAAGDLDGALERLATLDAPTRAVVIHRLARSDAAAALPLFERLCEASPADAEAVVSAVSQCPHERAVGLLARLAEGPDRTVQKAARRALHSMRTSGFEVPDHLLRPRGEAPAAPPQREGRPEARELPVYKCLAVFSKDRRLAAVNVAREYPNGRLQVLTAVVDFYKRGVRGARYYVDMSKSRFRRVLRESGAFRPEELPIEACRRLVARGIRVAREVGTPLPFDLQAGKHVLGDVMADVEAIEEPFRCSSCGGRLPAETIEQIRQAAAYEQVAVETRCEACRKDTIGL